MMAEAATTAAPPHAVKVWVDPRSLYFELRGANGPCVIAFPRTSAGFASAIATLFAIPEAGEPYSRPQLATSLPDKNGITGIQRSEARDILKRLKLI
jgi:hypothetical protein